MGQEQSNDKETKIEQPKEEQKEKKINIDPKTVLPPPPVYRRCGADKLKIKPLVINAKIVDPEKKNNIQK